MKQWIASMALVVVVVAGAGAGCKKQPDAVAADLQRLCQGLTEMNSRTYADGFERSAAMSRVISGAVREPATRDFFRTLAGRASSSARQDALRSFAADHGLANWRCAALEQ